MVNFRVQYKDLLGMFGYFMKDVPIDIMEKDFSDEEIGKASAAQVPTERIPSDVEKAPFAVPIRRMDVGQHRWPRQNGIVRPAIHHRVAERFQGGEQF